MRVIQFMIVLLCMQVSLFACLCCVYNPVCLPLLFILFLFLLFIILNRCKQRIVYMFTYIFVHYLRSSSCTYNKMGNDKGKFRKNIH